ncbi:hypothetical protein [Paenibacillus sp.]|uniref:hypothetical protein n=1 Tax=Paenibacillus sp. TaxID=58172 RepID=UPI0028B0E658|nr:hypothetical protein [Paenibacillus sp.]
MKKYSKLPMTYEQLKQSHDEWKQQAQHNFSFYKHEKVRADAAEGREQRLKEALELLLFMFRFDSEEGRAYMTFGDFEEVLDPDDHAAYIAASNLLSTIYPDTPAPKEDGSLVQCPKCDNRNLIAHPSQDNLWLCGPCNQVIEEGTDDNVD